MPTLPPERQLQRPDGTVSRLIEVQESYETGQRHFGDYAEQTRHARRLFYVDC